MNIRLNLHTEKLLKEQIANGPFRSAEEVIEYALEALAQKESLPRASVFSGHLSRRSSRRYIGVAKGSKAGRAKDQGSHS